MCSLYGTPWGAPGCSEQPSASKFDVEVLYNDEYCCGFWKKNRLVCPGVGTGAMVDM